MKSYAVFILLLCALAAVVFSIFGEDNYAKLMAMEHSLESQKRFNHELGSKVEGLREKVLGVVSDDRKLEKAARNELGLARPDEYIFIFEKRSSRAAGK